jgi:hypothetical protein
MDDLALERNRRAAWARFFAARRDAEQARLWAGELAFHLAAYRDDLPDEVTQLMDTVWDSLPRRDQVAIERYARALSTLRSFGGFLDDLLVGAD